MDVLIYGLPIIGTIGLAIFGVFYSSHKVFSIWILFFSIIILLLPIFMLWHQNTINTRNKILVVLHSVRVYVVEVDKDMYQIGLITEIANLDGEAHLLKRISFTGGTIDIAGRGQAHIRKLHNVKVYGESIKEFFIKPHDKIFSRILIPMKIEMTIDHQPPPEIIFLGKWLLSLEKETIEVYPKYYGNFDRSITENEWNNLLDGGEKDKLLNISLHLIPKHINISGPSKNYLIYNPDSSEKLNIYPFAKTAIVKNKKGQMTFIRGSGEPLLEDGWVVLGNTYQDVWKDSQKLELYNSIYPTNEDGSPRPFGVFAGLEKEMGVNLSVPTTRSRDILRIYPEIPEYLR